MSSSLSLACSGQIGKDVVANTVVDPLAGCDGVDLAPPAPGEGIQVSTEMTLEPGEEREICQFVLAGEAVNVNTSEGLWTAGSHHGLVFRTSYKDVFPETNLNGALVDASRPVTCFAANDWDTRGVIAGGMPIGGSASNPLEMPPDVAIKIASNDVLLLNFHMHNGTEQTMKSCYKANLSGIPDAEVKHEAGVTMWYNGFITVPAGGSSSAEMACPITHDVTFATAVSHMHSRGVGYEASLLSGDPIAGGKPVITLYESNDWAEPEPAHFPGGLALKQGLWIDWKCDYENPEQRNVAQGLQTTDEMCMFTGVYWPGTPEMDFCGSTNNRPPSPSGRPISHGTKNGADFVACMGEKSLFEIYGGGSSTSESRYALQKCVTDLCPEVSGRVWDFALRGLDISTLTCP